MKQFLVKLLLLSSMFSLVIVLILGCQIVREQRIRRSQLKLATNTEVLFLGDSHIRCGVNPEYFKNAQSFANDGEPMWVTQYKLEYLLKSAPTSLSVVVVGLAVHSPYFTFGQMQHYLASRKSCFGIIPFCPISDLAESIPQKWDIAIGGFHQLLRNFFTGGGYQLIGGHNPQKGNMLKVDKRESFIVANIDAKFGAHERFYNTNKKFIDVLNQMIDSCETNHVRIIFLDTPATNLYKERVPERYLESFCETTEWLKAKGCVFLNYWDYPLDEQFFYDVDHLNGEGVKEWSPFLVNELTVKCGLSSL